MANGELVVVEEVELVPLEPPTPIDIDAIVRPVLDADAGPAAGPHRRSPLDADGDGYPTRLRGGVVTTRPGLEAINRSVDYALMPWWRRLVTRRPAGYTTPLADWWEL